VSSRKHRYLTGYLPDFIQSATVNTNPVLEDGPAHSFFFQLVHSIADAFCPVFFRVLFSKILFDFLFKPLQEFFPGLFGQFFLDTLPDCRFHLWQGISPYLCLNLLRDSKYSVIIIRLGITFPESNFPEFTNKFHDLLDFLMSIHDSIKHYIFGNLFSSCFYHSDSISGPGNSNVHLTDLRLGQGGIDYKFTINPTYHNSRNGSLKRYIRQGKRCRSPCKSCYILGVILINRKNGCHNMDIIPVTLRK